MRAERVEAIQEGSFERLCSHAQIWHAQSVFAGYSKKTGLFCLYALRTYMEVYDNKEVRTRME